MGGLTIASFIIAIVGVCFGLAALVMTIINAVRISHMKRGIDNHNHNDGDVLLQADYVWHFFNAISVSKGKLPIYVGIGGRVVLADNTSFGIRIPVGIDYLFADAPIDIFLELVPIMDLSPETDFGIGGGIGIRYWFN